VGRKDNRRQWSRRLWMVAMAAVLFAVAPFAIALVGLALNNQYLETYHWLVYFSAPIGLSVAVIAALAAIAIHFIGTTKACERTDKDR
jgi:hypothetical protein